MNHATQRRPRGHARWQWCVAFAAVNGPPWFNRHFLVQWTALWVIRIPLLPAVALPYRIIWMKESPACVRVGWGGALEGLCAVRAVVSDQGRLYNPHTHTHMTPEHLPDVQTPNQPSSLTSVHPCVSNWNTNGFPLGWYGTRLPFPGTLLLTGWASLPTDCPHGHSCCHNTTPATFV